MIQQVKQKMKGTEKIYLLGLLYLFFFVSLQGQVPSQLGNTLDSTAAAQAAKQAELAHTQDSLAKAYVFIHHDAPNMMLDSLRAHIIVQGNDFLPWMEFMDSLRKKDNAPAASITKHHRPFWVIAVLASLILGVGLVRIFFGRIFKNIIMAYYNKQVLLNMNKEDSLLTSWPYVILYIIFSLSLGLFLLFAESILRHPGILTLENLWKTTAIVAILFAVKILVIRMLSAIFEIQRIVREYVIVVYLVYFNSMLILIPFLLFVTLLPTQYFNFLLILFAVIVAILFLYRFSIAAAHMLSQLRFSIFYIILYLCTLEIAPILILVKTLNS